MEKIILTQLQANAIELFKQAGTTIEEFARFAHVWKSDFSPLKGLTVDQMARILYEPGSYEVKKPEFEVGDWVVKNGKMQQIKSISESYACGERFAYATNKNSVVYKKEVRHATKEEAFWGELGREVGEFKEGDIYLDIDGEHFLITSSETTLVDTKISISEARGWCEEKDFTGFYPASSFIKFPVADDS